MVTETLLLTDPPRAAATLRRLHDAGFDISIDDFGAGQTSLGYLAMLPISELKIDKSFVLSMMGNQRDAAIVHSVIELGHSLGLSVTAEGVETTSILDRLRAYTCEAHSYVRRRASAPRHACAHSQSIRWPSSPRPSDPACAVSPSVCSSPDSLCRSGYMVAPAVQSSCRGRIWRSG